MAAWSQGWEDHSYFPKLSAADPRFEAKLDVLIQLDEAQAHDEIGRLHGIAQTIAAFSPARIALVTGAQLPECTAETGTGQGCWLASIRAP